MIRHTVVFSLNKALSAQEKEHFFEAAHQLAQIPGVGAFESLKQLSPKNSYEYGLSMEFATQAHYDHYTHHPAHIQFINQQWIPSVTDFLEIDYEPLIR